MKFANIQLLRALAANAVVLSHLHGIEEKYGAGVIVLPHWVGAIGPIGVHLFFVISGCVMVFAGTDRNWRRFLFLRAVRIYPIYWFYLSIFLAVVLLLPSATAVGVPDGSAIIKSYALWPDRQGPILPVAWSLLFEVYFYLVFAVLLFSRIDLRLGVALWGLLTIGVLSSLPASSPELQLVGSPLAFEFMFGAAVGFFVMSRTIAVPTFFLLGGIVALGASATYYINYAPANDTGLVTDLSLGLSFASILYGALGLEARRDEHASRFVTMLGDASYSLYLSHIIVLSAAGRVFASLHLAGYAAEILFVLLCLVATNLFGILSFKWLEIPVLRAGRSIAAATTRNSASNARNAKLKPEARLPALAEKDH